LDSGEGLCKEFAKEDAEGDIFVGRATSGGWWVKAKIKNDGDDEPTYLLSRAEGHELSYRHVALRELREMLK